jgi:hypothetical protein
MAFFEPIWAEHAAERADCEFSRLPLPDEPLSEAIELALRDSSRMHERLTANPGG